MSDARAVSGKANAAARLINSGNLSGAERLLAEVLSADPQQPRAHALMALLLYHRGRMTEAARQADIAIGLDPTDEAFRFKALALLKLKKRKNAIEAAEAAVRAGPTEGWNAFMLAVALENAKRPAEAEAAFRRAVELDPASTVFRGNLGRFLLRRRNFAEARQIAAELDPNADAEAVLLFRGDLALIDGSTGEARDYALWVLSRNATNEPALHLLTRVTASRSRLLGVWWRYCLFMVTKPRWLRLLILTPVFTALLIVSRFLVIILFLYLFISKMIFRNMVKRELETVKLRRDF